MRSSKYWDDFNRRIGETVDAVTAGGSPPVRRVAVFITDICNFHCSYCRHPRHPKVLLLKTFCDVLDKYGDTAIIHITGGEPSCVPWLYDFIRKVGHNYRFHLNTNAFEPPPAEHVKRLKISLDSHRPDYWDSLVGQAGAWRRVTDNISKATRKTIVSLTYTLTRENYQDAPDFARWAQYRYPELYAIFFSIYKGKGSRFGFTQEDADRFFGEVYPQLLEVLGDESRALIQETIDEKRRLMQGVRFPENTRGNPCYISMSERVISPDGGEYGCSHLYRDRIRIPPGETDDRCTYGCNRRLVMFNEAVTKKLGAREDVNHPRASGG